MDIFSTYSTQNIPIFLIDASGSVTTFFGKAPVFDKIKNIIIGLREEQCRIIFWNSDNNTTFFTDGIYKLPFIVKRDTINTTFMHVVQKISPTCLTYPHIAFDNIPDEWINDVNLTKIYFMTDGQIGFNNAPSHTLRELKNKLSDSITRLFKKHNNIQLNIITVEPVVVDLTTKESTTTAAGCDVYNVIMENHLTTYITKFIAYTLNNDNGFIHINRNTPPVGFAPYGEKFFPIIRTSEFIDFVMHEISATTDEEKLLQIVQYLSSTITYLIKDKPTNISDGIISTFCSLFKHTKLDRTFVKFILTEAIHKESSGMASIYSAYREQLKNLYKHADNLLHNNVRDAIGLTNRFITLPLCGRIISGNYRMIDANVYTKHDTVYKCAGVTINKKIIPVVPLTYNDSLINEQCVRQWIRAIVSNITHIGSMDDDIIYIVLGYMLQVVLSDVDDTIKNSFRQLGSIMLKKKRLSTDKTELSRLEDGELPIDNKGNVESFFRFMNTVSKCLNINLHPFVLWYAMCLALDNKDIILRQRIHCNDDIIKYYGNVEPENLLSVIKSTVPRITHIEIPDESLLDYNCIITLDDTSKTGGFKFLSHNSPTGESCCPMNVLSSAGYSQLISNPETCVCPICYVKLSHINFVKIGEKPPMYDSSNILPDDFPDIFNSSHSISQSPSSTPCSSGEASSTFTTHNKLIGTGTIILMNGTVGSGKSYFSNLLKKYIEDHGSVCISEGIDKYCRDGMAIKDAVSRIHDNILDMNNDCSGKNKFIIIDTCGENNKETNIFNVDVSNWKIINIFPNLLRSNLEGYLCWSLRNVLLRHIPTSSDTFWLNPINAGLKRCISVHSKKCKALFGNKIPKIFSITPIICSDAIQLLNNRADAYFELIKSELPIDKEIEKLYSSL